MQVPTPSLREYVQHAFDLNWNTRYMNAKIKRLQQVTGFNKRLKQSIEIISHESIICRDTFHIQ